MWPRAKEREGRGGGRRKPRRKRKRKKRKAALFSATEERASRGRRGTKRGEADGAPVRGIPPPPPLPLPPVSSPPLLGASFVSVSRRSHRFRMGRSKVPSSSSSLSCCGKHGRYHHVHRYYGYQFPFFYPASSCFRDDRLHRFPPFRSSPYVNFSFSPLFFFRWTGTDFFLPFPRSTLLLFDPLRISKSKKSGALQEKREREKKRSAAAGDDKVVETTIEIRILRILNGTNRNYRR